MKHLSFLFILAALLAGPSLTAQEASWKAEINSYTLNDGVQVLGRLCVPRAAQPVQPTQATQPASSAQATKPVQPTLATTPVQPTQATQPASNAQATKPVLPTQPVKATTPAGAPITTLVFCIHGTGPNTFSNRRDGFAYYDALASGFCHNGVAFFSYNRRGVSEGTASPMYDSVDRAQYEKYVPLQEAQDVEAMVQQLRQDPRLTYANLILYGISEGTIIATMVADRHVVEPMALFLHGYANENMYDIIRWQNQGHGLMFTLLNAFDKDGNQGISQTEYAADDATSQQYRSYLFQDAPFESLDVVQDQVIDIKDIAQLREPFYEALMERIQDGDAAWLWKNYFRITPQWLKAHFALEPNKTRMLRLNLPISIFHGEEDANVPVEGVYDIAARFSACNKKNLSTFIFPKHNHDLNFQDWIPTHLYPAGLQGLFNRAQEYTTPLFPSAQLIWQTEGHCAFTDMEQFLGTYYITFREAASHIFDKEGKAEGRIRILASADGTHWESVALLQKEGMDLRDPKLSVTPDGRLMVMMGGSVYENRRLTACVPQVAFSTDGLHYSAPQPLHLEASHPLGRDWVWRVTWQGRIGYAISYFPGGADGNRIALYQTRDGISYKEVTPLDVPGSPNEATIRFLPDKTMLAMVRREGGNRLGYWGTSRPPYKKWTWTPMSQRIGGPDFLSYNGTILAGTRCYGKYGENKTVLLQGLGDGTFTESLLLPSGGDTSYPGMLLVGDELWFCYYSTHQTPNAAIYLAKIPLGMFR